MFIFKINCAQVNGENNVLVLSSCVTVLVNFRAVYFKDEPLPTSPTFNLLKDVWQFPAQLQVTAADGAFDTAAECGRQPTFWDGRPNFFCGVHV